MPPRHRAPTPGSPRDRSARFLTGNPPSATAGGPLDWVFRASGRGIVAHHPRRPAPGRCRKSAGLTRNPTPRPRRARVSGHGQAAPRLEEIEPRLTAGQQQGPPPEAEAHPHLGCALPEPSVRAPLPARPATPGSAPCQRDLPDAVALSPRADFPRAVTLGRRVAAPRPVRRPRAGPGPRPAGPVDKLARPPRRRHRRRLARPKAGPARPPNPAGSRAHRG